MTKEKIILWIASFIITFLVVYSFNLFNKNYPITGTFGIEGKKVSYRFEKVHYGSDSVETIIRTDLKGLAGKLFWKSENDSIWNINNLKESDLILSAKLPALKPDQKLSYFIELNYKDKKYLLPDNRKVEMHFFGKIPSTVSSLQFIFFNLGLLLVIRVGLEYFNKNEKIKKFEFFISVIFLTLVALINPLYITYKHGFINSSIPDVTKLFPVKELSITALWIITTIITFNIKRYKIVPLLSAIITLLILYIIH